MASTSVAEVIAGKKCDKAIADTTAPFTSQGHSEERTVKVSKPVPSLPIVIAKGDGAASSGVNENKNDLSSSADGSVKLDDSEDAEKSSLRRSIKDSSVSAKCRDRASSLPKASGSAKVSGQPADMIDSGKSSLYRASDGSDVSNESTCSSICSSVSKPHKSNDSKWEAIQAVRMKEGSLGLGHFRLLKSLGCGDIGSVYLSELSGTKCYFATKIMDKASLASRKKLLRAQTEREILQCLDHPFLPTLYTHFETDKFSCLVMEFCPGGDLHTLRQKQPGKYFPEQAAKLVLRSEAMHGKSFILELFFVVKVFIWHMLFVMDSLVAHSLLISSPKKSEDDI